MKIIEKVSGTHEAETVEKVHEIYEKIQLQQAEWYEKSQFLCPEGCGECCRNFEPDLLECEALYMAAWLLENQPEVADEVCNEKYPFSKNKGCPFWNENLDYHCTIYGGRPFVCRLFGACGNRGKDGSIVFKPCRFYPAEKLSLHNPPLSHKQFTQEETQSIFNCLPPVMSDLMEAAVSIVPDSQETKLIREVLPETIRRLKWILSMISGE